MFILTVIKMVANSPLSEELRAIMFIACIHRTRH